MTDLYAVWSNQYIEATRMNHPHRPLHVWKGEDGKEIVCTAVVNNPSSYKWPDAVVLGKVTRWLRNENRFGF